MPYNFNPFTGTFDYYQAASGAQYIPTVITNGINSPYVLPINTQTLFREPIVMGANAVILGASNAYLVGV